LIVPFALPLSQMRLTTLATSAADPVWRTRLLLVCGLAAVCGTCLWLSVRLGRGWKPCLPLAAAIACVIWGCWLIPLHGGIRFLARLKTDDVAALAAWARAGTAPEDIFLFPQAREGLHPGLFRAFALRPVYVDWKSGGQVNYFTRYSKEWWNRWRETMAAPFAGGSTRPLAERGIRYLVLEKDTPVTDARLVYSNAVYKVYDLLPGR